MARAMRSPCISISWGSELVPFVPIVPIVPAPPAFLEDERDVLDADEWDDLKLAEFLARPCWAGASEAGA